MLLQDLDVVNNYIAMLQFCSSMQQADGFIWLADWYSVNVLQWPMVWVESLSSYKLLKSAKP